MGRIESGLNKIAEVRQNERALREAWTNLRKCIEQMSPDGEHFAGTEQELLEAASNALVLHKALCNLGGTKRKIREAISWAKPE